VEAACWVHARRPFFILADVAAKAGRKAQGKTASPISPLALEAVRRIDALFDIERSIKCGYAWNKDSAFGVMVRAYPREAQEMVFEAHNRAFAFFKGSCTRGMYENTKRRSKPCSLAKTASSTAAFCGCVAITWSS